METSGLAPTETTATPANRSGRAAGRFRVATLFWLVTATATVAGWQAAVSSRLDLLKSQSSVFHGHPQPSATTQRVVSQLAWGAALTVAGASLASWHAARRGAWQPGQYLALVVAIGVLESFITSLGWWFVDAYPTTFTIRWRQQLVVDGLLTAIAAWGASAAGIGWPWRIALASVAVSAWFRAALSGAMGLSAVQHRGTGFLELVLSDWQAIAPYLTTPATFLVPVALVADVRCWRERSWDHWLGAASWLAPVVVSWLV